MKTNTNDVGGWTRCRYAFATLCFMLALPWASTFAEDAEVLTNQSILDLTEAGLPPVVIVAKISASQSSFDTSVEQLVALSAAGVDASVMEAMTKSELPEPAPSVNSTLAQPAQSTVRMGASRASNLRTNFQGTPCATPGIFLEDGGELHELDMTSTSQVRTGSGIVSALTYGIASTKSKASVRGTRAMLRSSDTLPSFLFCFEESEGGLSYQTKGAVSPSEFLLVIFDVSERRRQRTFEIGKLNVWTGAQSGTPPRQVKEITWKKLSAGVFRVTPFSDLGPGEFGFYYGGETSSLAAYGFTGFGESGNKIFAFGVDSGAGKS